MSEARLCSRSQHHRLSGLRVGDNSEKADEAVWALARAFPEYSAHIRVTRPQIAAMIAIVAVVAVGALLAPRGVAIAVASAMAIGFVANVIFRSLLIWIGAGEEQAAAPVHRLSDNDLPRYTVLVPVYREAAVLPALIGHLRALDYPLGQLDIRIVTESDDRETVEAAEHLATGSAFTVVKVPVCHPRTKPNSCVALLIGTLDWSLVFDFVGLFELWAWPRFCVSA